ncbi:hypothetical protein D3C75_921460 [compost metagenome]
MDYHLFALDHGLDDNGGDSQFLRISNDFMHTGDFPCVKTSLCSSCHEAGKSVPIHVMGALAFLFLDVFAAEVDLVAWTGLGRQYGRRLMLS